MGRRRARQSAATRTSRTSAAATRARCGTCCCRHCRRLQARVGWISEGGLGYVCDRLNVPPADAWGVATFYALLATSPRPPARGPRLRRHRVQVRGARRGDRGARSRSGAGDPARPGGSSVTIGDGAVWMRSPCLGMCDQAPAALVTDAGEQPREASDRAGHRRAARWPDRWRRSRTRPPAGRPFRSRPAELRLLRRVGRDRSARASTSTAPRAALHALAQGARDRAGSGRDRRSHRRQSSWAAAARRFRPAASGRPCAPSRRSRTIWSATPTSRSPARSRIAC